MTSLVQTLFLLDWCLFIQTPKIIREQNNVSSTVRSAGSVVDISHLHRDGVGLVIFRSQKLCCDGPRNALGRAIFKACQVQKGKRVHLPYCLVPAAHNVEIKSLSRACLQNLDLLDPQCDLFYLRYASSIHPACFPTCSNPAIRMQARKFFLSGALNRTAGISAHN